MPEKARQNDATQGEKRLNISPDRPDSEKKKEPSIDRPLPTLFPPTHSNSFRRKALAKSAGNAKRRRSHSERNHN